MNITVKEAINKLPHMADSLEEHAELIDILFPWEANSLSNIAKVLRDLHEALGLNRRGSLTHVVPR